MGVGICSYNYTFKKFLLYWEMKNLVSEVTNFKCILKRNLYKGDDVKWQIKKQLL